MNGVFCMLATQCVMPDTAVIAQLCDHILVETLVAFLVIRAIELYQTKTWSHSAANAAEPDTCMTKLLQSLRLLIR